MRTILAVDDRKEILAGIEQLLSGECQVIAVSSRAMALKFLQQRLPHLVLVNTEMAEMDGLRLYVEMRENEKWEKIPVEKITYPFDAAALKQRVEMLLLEGAQEDNAYLPVIKDGRITEIPVDQIECVEIYDQVVIVRLQYQELRTRMTAGHIKKCLGERFLNVGDGLLINKKLIQNVSEGILYMKSGREHVLPLYERKKLTEQVKKMLLIERASEA